MFRLGVHRGKYAVTWHDRGTRRASLGLDATRENRLEAERRFDAWKRALEEVNRSEKPTVGQVLEGYVNDRKAVVMAPDRLEYARQALAPLHDKEAESLAKQACRDFSEVRIEAGISTATVATELGMLRSALIWAARERWIERAPHVPIPLRPPSRDRWLTKAEAHELLAAARAPHIRLFTNLALTTAARKEAILDLTWDRVDFDHRLVDFNPPFRLITSKRRSIVPMNDTLTAALTVAKEAAITDYVIEYAGGRVRDIKKGFAAAVRRAGLERVTPHTLRHTAATWMAQEGVSLDRIAEYLGHTDSRTTRKYAHWQPDFLRDAAGALELKGPKV